MTPIPNYYDLSTLFDPYRPSSSRQSSTESPGPGAETSGAGSSVTSFLYRTILHSPRMFRRPRQPSSLELPPNLREVSQCLDSIV